MHLTAAFRVYGKRRVSNIYLNPLVKDLYRCWWWLLDDLVMSMLIGENVVAIITEVIYIYYDALIKYYKKFHCIITI